MGALLGPVDGLERVASPTSEPVEVGPVFTLSKALSGRVTAQRSPNPKRSWSCSENTVRAEDAALLEGLAAGRMYDQSSGYVWYSSYSVVTNILTPDEGDLYGASWAGGAPGGAGTAADGTRYLLSRTAGVGETISLAAPLAVPGQWPVVVSAYVSTHPVNPATVRVTELDPEGATVGTPHTIVIPANVHAHRAVITFTSSVRTRALEVKIVSPLMTTLAAATLTHSVQPWASGRGCRHAVINLSGEDPHLAFETPNNQGRRAGRSFTIHEIG